MSKEPKLLDQQDRGERATIVLKELEAAFETLEKQCFESFSKSDMHDDAGRKTCRLYLRVMDDVRQRFNSAIITGEAARKELILIKPKSRLRNIING